MQRQLEHPLPGVGDRAARVDRAEAGEQAFGRGDGLGLGRIEPGEIARARRVELEDGLREIDAHDLRRVVLGPRVVIGLRVEAERAPGTRSSGTAGALGRRRAARLLDRRRRQAGPGRVPRDAHEAAVDHGDDAIDGDARLRDVRREDDLALAGCADGAVLLCRREVAVERQEREVVLARELRAALECAPDVGGAGEEDEDVSVESVETGRDERTHRGRDLQLEPAIVGAREVLDRDVEAFPFGADHSAAEERRDRRGVERRRHGGEAEVGAACLLETPQECERDVALEVALVDLVEQHRSHAAKGRVGDEAACEHALGDEAHPRPAARHVLEPHGVPDGLADALAELVGDAPRGKASREAARLEHDDLAVEPGVEQRARRPRRLARTGRCLEHDARAGGSEGPHDVRKNVVDRERGELHRFTERERRRRGPTRERQRSPVNAVDEPNVSSKGGRI